MFLMIKKCKTAMIFTKLLQYHEQGGPRGRTGLTEPLLICDLPGQNITANPTLRGEAQVNQC